jgi:hypothetical protein
MANYQDRILLHTPKTFNRLLEPYGATSVDSSGNGNTATLTGYTRNVVGPLPDDDGDTGTTFTGVGAVNLPASLGVGSWTAITLEFWIQLTGKWQYIAVTYDGTTTRTYLNGMPYVSGSGDAVVISSDFSYAGSVSAGNLSEIAVYNYAMPQITIYEHWVYGTCRTGTISVASGSVAGLYAPGRP